MWDVAIVGGGLSGMASAARLQARGLSTIVLESHGHVGGCAGYYRRRGFSFDVGATTLVDFAAGGVGGRFFEDIGMSPPPMRVLPGYVAWLPDQTITLHRDPDAWKAARMQLGDTAGHRRFWDILDRIADAFWPAARGGVRLPIRSLADVFRAMQVVRPRDLPLTRYLRWTVADLLTHCRVADSRPLAGLLSMIIEDTVHATLDRAPLINASLGVTMRGAGLCRARGGMRGFWTRFVSHYRGLGGTLCLADQVHRITGRVGEYRIESRGGMIEARQVVCALPAETVARIGPKRVASALRPYLERDAEDMGGAMTVYLGVPEEEVSGQPFTHHQLMQEYDRPLGDGNNMFISVSESNDLESAPADCRAVMISTHCELGDWSALDEVEHADRKREASARLLTLARRVYPALGTSPAVFESGTPRTFERFTLRPRGAVGGARLNRHNSNQHAIPHQLGQAGFHLVGDSTWPGLGTVACVLGSGIVTENVLSAFPHRRLRPRPEQSACSASTAVVG